jgi:hypothetical protein
VAKSKAKGGKLRPDHHEEDRIIIDRLLIRRRYCWIRTDSESKLTKGQMDRIWRDTEIQRNRETEQCFKSDSKLTGGKYDAGISDVKIGRQSFDS